MLEVHLVPDSVVPPMTVRTLLVRIIALPTTVTDVAPVVPAVFVARRLLDSGMHCEIMPSTVPFMDENETMTWADRSELLATGFEKMLVSENHIRPATPVCTNRVAPDIPIRPCE